MTILLNGHLLLSDVIFVSKYNQEKPSPERG